VIPRIRRRLPLVTGARVLSDWLVVRVTVDPGEAFLDRMISMVESARRQKRRTRSRLRFCWSS
jgi:high-affinity K+ transport system ATPase subunit B